MVAPLPSFQCRAVTPVVAQHPLLWQRLLSLPTPRGTTVCALALAGHTPFPRPPGRLPRPLPVVALASVNHEAHAGVLH